MPKATLVSIKFGPFAGLSGVVTSTSGERTTVRIILKRRAVLVELDTNMIDVPVRRGLYYLPRRARPL